MPTSYPEQAIWFVQASLPDGSGLTEGSAVAVRLQKIGQPETAETYLLTCAHVVRGTAGDGGAGYGRLLPVIRAWAPDTGLTERQGRAVRIAESIKAPAREEVAAADRPNAFDDWVILKFASKADAEASPVVSRWADGDLTGRFWVCGYLGAASLPGDVVRPTRTPESFPIRDERCGAFCLTGAGTRAGFSGAGVFGPGDVFAGIHRGRSDGTLQLCGVSGSYIGARLHEKGFELARRPDRTPAGPRALAGPRRALGEILGDPIASGLDWHGALALSVPPSYLPEVPATGPADEPVLAHAVDELESLNLDGEGVYPLFRFAHHLSRLEGIDAALTARIEDWLRTHCPAEQRALLGRSRPAGAPAEPRIVIQMTRDADAEGETDRPAPAPPGAPREERFRYNTWFLGFPDNPGFREHTDSRDGFVRVLEEAWSAVRGQHDPASVWVELFLEKGMFSWAVEKERARIVKLRAPVGARHRFVLRFDRGREGERPMETRCNRARERARKSGTPIRLDCSLSLQDIPATPGDDRHFMVALDVKTDPDDLESMSNRLLQKSGVLGVLWTAPPESSAGDDEPDVWDVVAESGVPVVMWLRDCPTPCQGADWKGLFQQKEWDELAAEVQGLRLDATTHDHAQWHVGRSLAVVVDDPRRPLPLRPATRGDRARFRSPASAG